ncbi:MAG: hypothetical protein REI11_07650 [Patulibacter sp.]|nr:hypothetical protein [Patulibacter sp.]
MLKTRFALLASAATIALAGCGAAASSDTTASVTGGTTPQTATGAPSGTTPGGGTRPQMQTVTGTAAAKAKAAALAKYPGTAGDVLQVADGYMVRVTTSSGEKMVAVSSAFKVTGLAQRPTGGQGGGTPPSGVQPRGSEPSSTTPADVTSS